LSTPFQLIVPRSIYDDMIAQARSELPNECCGFLAGNIHPPSFATHPSLPVGRVECRYPLVSSPVSPTKYEADSKSLIEAHRDMRRQGIHELAIYHSHPRSAPVPSRTDLERNYYPGVVHLIISLKDGEPQVRGWWLEEHNFREADWRLAD
jgi:proteasome lid subunit RPN8/RPN11